MVCEILRLRNREAVYERGNCSNIFLMN